MFNDKSKSIKINDLQRRITRISRFMTIHRLKKFNFQSIYCTMRKIFSSIRDAPSRKIDRLTEQATRHQPTQLRLPRSSSSTTWETTNWKLQRGYRGRFPEEDWKGPKSTIEGPLARVLTRNWPHTDTSWPDECSLEKKESSRVP